MTLARTRTRLIPATVLLLAATAAPAFTSGTADAEPSTSRPSTVHTLGDPVHGLLDVDRRGAVAPLDSQRAAVAALGAVSLRWNDLGSPASVLPRDGSLGAAPGSPADGARAWLAGHAALFGLTAAQVADLDLVNSQELAGSDARG